MPVRFTTSYIEDVLAILSQYKSGAERAIAQVKDDELTKALDPEGNSIAILVQHMAGNMRSRFTDFLTTDGEKPNRNRDAEFENQEVDRDRLTRNWEDGWLHVFSALQPLTEADLSRTVTIRGEAHSVMQAINRQLAHYAQHVGQIVLLAKHFAGPDWQTLSIPRHRTTKS